MTGLRTRNTYADVELLRALSHQAARVFSVTHRQRFVLNALKMKKKNILKLSCSGMVGSTFTFANSSH